jgi:hypothetical protein
MAEKVVEVVIDKCVMALLQKCTSGKGVVLILGKNNKSYAKHKTLNTVITR